MCCFYSSICLNVFRFSFFFVAAKLCSILAPLAFGSFSRQKASFGHRLIVALGESRQIRFEHQSLIQCCETVTICYSFGSEYWQVTVLVPALSPVPVPAPYQDQEKHSLKIFAVKNLAFLLLIEAALMSRNLLNEGNQYTIFILCLWELFVIPLYYGSDSAKEKSYGSGSATLN